MSSLLSTSLRALLLGLALARPSFAAPVAVPARLDLPTALALFHERGYDLLLADAQIAAAAGERTSAAAVQNPGLSLGFGKSFGCNSGCAWIGAPAWSVSLSDSGALLDLVIGKRRLRTAIAQAALEAARFHRGDAERLVRAEVEQAYAQAVLSQQLLRLARESQQSAHDLVSLTRVRYHAGAISEADVARAETDALESDQGVDQAEADLRSAQLALAFLIGARGEVPPFEVEPDGLPGSGAPAFVQGRTDADLVHAALDQRPDLRALRASLTGADRSVALQRRERMSDLGLTVGYAQQGTSFNAITPPTVSVGLSGSLPLFNQRQGEIAKAEADRRAAQLELEQAESQAATEVQDALASFRAAESQLQRMEGGLLERARRARDLVEVQYTKGAASLLELLDAQRTYRQIAAEHAQDLNRYWTAVFKLEAAVGVNP